MTLHKVDSIWLSGHPDTDCNTCGLRYFAECLKCKKLVCTWCCFVAETPLAKEVVACKECRGPQEGRK